MLIASQGTSFILNALDQKKKFITEGRGVVFFFAPPPPDKPKNTAMQKRQRISTVDVGLIDMTGVRYSIRYICLLLSDFIFIFFLMRPV